MFEADLGNQEKRRFVLLAQPCDISVRATGARKSDEAIFVEVIKDAHENSKGGSAPMVFEIPSFEGDGVEYLSFRCWGFVNLRCLDFAVFDPGGRVRFDRKQSNDVEKTLLPGWAVRLNQAKADIVPALLEALARGLDGAEADAGFDGKDEAERASLQIPNVYRLLSLSKNVPAQEGRVDSAGNLVFAYRRIGRLRAQRAVAAYAAFSSYQTRGAFEHNFSRLTEQKKPKGTGGKPPEPKKPKGANTRQKGTGGKPTGHEGAAKGEVGHTQGIEEKPMGE
jgi:hypothetical protein